MEWLLFILAYGIIGTIVGRILFKKRLGRTVRYEFARVNDYMHNVKKR